MGIGGREGIGKSQAGPGGYSQVRGGVGIGEGGGRLAGQGGHSQLRGGGVAHLKAHSLRGAAITTV